MFTAANSIVPALLRASITIRDCVALIVPRVDPLEITKFAGVPETVVIVPLPRVVERKSREHEDRETVKALEATDAVIENTLEKAFVNIGLALKLTVFENVICDATLILDAYEASDSIRSTIIVPAKIYSP